MGRAAPPVPLRSIFVIFDKVVSLVSRFVFGQFAKSGELLEDYPEDPRGHSCLVLGFTPKNRAIHSVWGLLPDGRVRLITVYLPLPPKWIDPRRRRRRE
ncbi:MAG: DUF4258 domain-containing protein [Anaerolineae bacterium]